MICGVQTKILVFSILAVKKSIFKQREFEKRYPGRWWRNKIKVALQIQTSGLLTREKKKKTSVIFKSLYLGASLPKKPAALGASVGRKHTVSKQWLLLTVFSVCVCVCALTQSRLTLCDPMDCRPSASSVHGIILTRILEWIDMPFSRGSSWPRDQTSISCVSCIGRQILHPWVTWEALALRQAFPERDELRQGSFVSKKWRKMGST